MESVAGFAFLVAAMACGGGEAAVTGGSVAASSGRPTTGTTPAVVLISIDTLRSDRLPVYGSDRIETPAIDRLRRDGVLLEHAYCHMSLTLPSHVSILTGLRPDQSGVRDNVGYALDEELATLPAVLRANGFATGGAVSSFVLRRATGIARGFDWFDDEVEVTSGVELGALQRPGLETLDRAKSWLQDVADQPFFLFFHIYEPHSPYTPSEPWASRYPDPYDAEVAEADAVVGGLLDELRRLGVYDRALIVLLSDHGEGLMDHGEMEHEVLLYREVLQVPLLVKLPGGARAGAMVSAPAQLTDVLPTVLDQLGIERPPGIEGADLLELDARPPRTVIAESLYPRLHFGWSDLTSAIDHRHHLIDGPRPELYDLRADPAEQRDLAAGARERVDELRRAITAIDRQLEGPSEVDEETRAQLAQLGYVSGGDAATIDLSDRRGLANPRDKIDVLTELGAAARLLVSNRPLQAAEAYRRIVEREPGMIYAWEQLGKSLRRAERYPEAHSALSKALELAPASGAISLALAEVELRLGDLAAAGRHARAALPLHEAAWDLVAQVALRQNDLRGAEEAIEQALATRGRRVEPLITLVELRVRQERHEEALAVADQVLSEFGARTDREVLRGLEFQRGNALASLNRLEDAERAFRSEIELAPDEIAPYTRLALVYALDGKRQRVAEVLRDLVERNQRPEAYAEAVRALRALGDTSSARGLLASALRRWPEDPDLRALATNG